MPAGTPTMFVIQHESGASIRSCRAARWGLVRPQNSSSSPKLREALRYTELNPLRARLVSAAELWPWSSAASHCGARADDDSLTLEMWRGQWTATAWREYLGAGEMESRLAVIRQRTHTGRPLGTAEFVQDLEKATQRRLALQKRGPREKIVTDRRQGELTFDP
jgi:putative transposase